MTLLCQFKRPASKTQHTVCWSVRRTS